MNILGSSLKTVEHLGASALRLKLLSRWAKGLAKARGNPWGTVEQKPEDLSSRRLPAEEVSKVFDKFSEFCFNYAKVTYKPRRSVKKLRGLIHNAYRSLKTVGRTIDDYLEWLYKWRFIPIQFLSIEYLFGRRWLDSYLTAVGRLDSLTDQEYEIEILLEHYRNRFGFCRGSLNEKMANVFRERVGDMIKVGVLMEDIKKGMDESNLSSPAPWELFRTTLRRKRDLLKEKFGERKGIWNRDVESRRLEEFYWATLNMACGIPLDDKQRRVFGLPKTKEEAEEILLESDRGRLMLLLYPEGQKILKKSKAGLDLLQENVDREKVLQKLSALKGANDSSRR